MRAAEPLGADHDERVPLIRRVEQGRRRLANDDDELGALGRGSTDGARSERLEVMAAIVQEPAGVSLRFGGAREQRIDDGDHDEARFQQTREPLRPDERAR